MNKISRQLTRIAISVSLQDKLKNDEYKEELTKKLEQFKNNGITINELLKILNIDKSTYYRNKKFIQGFLESLKIQKGIEVKIIKSQPTFKESLNNNKEQLKEKLRNKKLTIDGLCKILGIDRKTYYNNKDFIQNFLKDIQSQITIQKTPLKKSLNENKKELKKKLEEISIDKQITIDVLCEILDINVRTYYDNKEFIQNFLKEINVTINKAKPHLKEFLNENKEQLKEELKKFKDSGITISELCEILEITDVTYYNNKELIQNFLKEINVTINREKYPFEKSLKVNKERLRNKKLTIDELCEILEITDGTYYRNKEFIQNFLKDIQTQIIIQKTPLEKSLNVNKEQLKEELKKFKDNGITISELLKILGISDQAYYRNKELIQDFLKDTQIQIKKEKSVLQNSFYTQIKILPNVKIAEPEIIINCETEANDTIKKIIKDYNNFQKRQNIAKNTKTVIANKNDQKLNVLMNQLDKYLNDLSRAKIDFYVETFNGNRYLIQCQGNHHYDLQSKRNNNIITRIVTDVAKMLVACKYNCNFIATYDVKAKKRIKESLDVFNKFYMTTEEAIQLIKNEGTVDKYKIKSCAINMLNKIRNFFEKQIDQLSQKLKGQKKTNKEILEKIRKY